MIDSRFKQAHGHLEREEWAAAWTVSSEILNENPESEKGLYCAGVVMRQMGHIGVALQLFRRALAMQSRVPNIWMHYGACLHDTHKYEEALEAFRVVAKALPKDPMPWANMAGSFIQQGKPREAVEHADKALTFVSKWLSDGGTEAAASRATFIANVSRAFGCLALGRWADGWKSAAYLYGDHLTIRVYNPPEREEPQWDGSPGKTVVVQADQGLGDMIMFSQCLPQMVKDCKKVIIETNERLVNLFQRNFPETDVYGTLKDRTNVLWPEKYQIDAHIHISFLGKFYRTKDADFPKVAYITPNPEMAAKWRAWLEQFPRPWIGYAWRGGIQRTNEASRSLPLSELGSMLNQSGTPISLAYQDVGREIAVWNLENKRAQVIVPPLTEDDYDETVALISQLDEVVTVQTTVAHVCGALGKRASVLVNNSPQWRYCYGGDHLMWYPDTLKLYRMAPGEKTWDYVIRRASKQALAIAA